MVLHALSWDARFVTGLEPIDGQHRELVGRINAFGALVADHASVSPQSLAAMLEALTAYAAVHFADEEALQEKEGVEAGFLAAHRAEHARFAEEVARRTQGSLVDGRAAWELFSFLIRWVTAHILGTDRLAAQQVQLIRRGLPPADALRQVMAETAHRASAVDGAVYDAVDELLALVSRRNRELESLNASLDARVRARTAELEAALADLRKTQAQLVDAAKLASLGQLASGLAHELNSPLGAALANLNSLRAATDAVVGAMGIWLRVEPRVADEGLRAELAAARLGGNLDHLREDLPAMISESEDSLRRAADLVRALKDLNRVDASGRRPVELNRAVETAVAMVPAALRAVPVALELGRVPPVPAQGAAVCQAILALLTNGAQAVRDRGGARADAPRVAVRTGVSGGRAFVEVADNGVGLAPEVRAHLFEPFFTTRRPGNGRGLGLAAAWGTAQAHRGTIEVESEPGVGSTFTLWLPVEEPGGGGATD